MFISPIGSELPWERMRTLLAPEPDACRVWMPYGEPLRTGSLGGDVLRGDMGMIERESCRASGQGGEAKVS